MAGELDGRVAVVTGGRRGIGRGIAERFRDEGAKVAVLDREVEPIDGVLSIAADITDESQVLAAFAQIGEELGTPWALVNSAGIGPAVPFLELGVDAWREMLAVNLEGTFLCAREAARAMVAGGAGGRIVNIGSQIGLKGGVELAHYAASKAGVHGFTRAIARELAPSGINVNAIAPGPIDTEMLMGMPDDWLAAKQAELPLGRFGRVEEIVPTALLLVSPVGGAYITGAVMNLSGGDVMAD